MSRIPSRRTLVIVGISVPVAIATVIALTTSAANSAGNIGPDGGPIIPDIVATGPVGPAPSAFPTVEPQDPVRSASASCTSGGGTADRAAAVVRQALEFRQKLNLPDQPSAQAAASATTRQALVARGQAQVPGLFSGDEAKRELDLVDTANSPTSAFADVRPLGGGVSHFACTDAVVSGTTVEIHATATTWARMAFVEDGVLTYAQPSNEILVQATVSMNTDTSGMTVSYLATDFAPGNEP